MTQKYYITDKQMARIKVAFEYGNSFAMSELLGEIEEIQYLDTRRDLNDMMVKHGRVKP